MWPLLNDAITGGQLLVPVFTPGVTKSFHMCLEWSLVIVITSQKQINQCIGNMWDTPCQEFVYVQLFNSERSPEVRVLRRFCRIWLMGGPAHLSGYSHQQFHMLLFWVHWPAHTSDGFLGVAHCLYKSSRIHRTVVTFATLVWIFLSCAGWLGPVGHSEDVVSP